MVMIASTRPARCAQTYDWREHTVSSSATSSLGTYPVDAAASHNNARGAVRFANPNSNDTVVGLWNLTTSGVTPTAPMGVLGGGALRSGDGTSLGPNPLTTYQPSDRIELTNSVGVSIGAGSSGTGSGQDETYIEVFDFSPLTLRYQHVEGAVASDPNYESVRAGRAHDVAITRDGEWAVVNSDNWIHVIDLTPPSGGPDVYSFNIGRFDYSNPTTGPQVWNRPCTPNFAVDSVAVTNDRAVVITARENTSLSPAAYTTWVYIIDFHDPFGTGGPGIVLQHEIPPEDGEFPTEYGDWPHDLAITPHTDIESSGQALAVVTTVHSVAAYNLVTDSFLNSFTDKEDRRFYQWQVDSVEMTGKMAVVISDKPTMFGDQWRIKFFQLSASVGLIPDQLYEAGSEIEDRAHDLALSRDHDKGLVRTSLHNVVLEDLSSPPPQPSALPPIPSPNGSNAHAYDQFRSANSYVAFSSDSVVIGTMQDDNGQTRLMAVTIGASSPDTFSWQTAVDVLDLNAAVPSVLSQVIVNPNGTERGGCVPLDLAIGHNQTEVVVRSSDPLAEASGAAGPDLARITILPVGSIGVIHAYGGNGSPFALDSLAVPPLSGLVNTTRRILSVSQDEYASPTGFDYIHIAR